MEQYEKTVDKALNAAEKVSRGMNKVYIGCSIIFMNLFFAAFCLWGLYAAYTAYKLDANGETTTGTVVELDESNDSDGGCCVYTPIVEFQANGQTYSFDSDNASDPPAYQVGEIVPVIYDPSDPNTAQINKWSERWLFPMIIIPTMIIGAIITTFFLIRAWRRDEIVLE